MNNLLQHTTILRVVIALAILTQGGVSSALCEEGAKVANVHYEVANGTVVIHYDFLGSASDKFRIDLFLRSEKDPAFKYEPKNIVGDWGPGNHAGTDRQIVWQMKGEFPQGIEGSDYYFEVRAERVSSFNGTLLWIGAGVAVLGTIAAVHFLGGGPADSPSDNSQFPAPPGRP